MSGAERGETSGPRRNPLGEVVEVLKTAQMRTAFLNADSYDRQVFLNQVSDLHQLFSALNSAAKAQEKSQLGRNKKPEDIIAHLFRQGRYLNIPPEFASRNTRRSVVGLARDYRQHIWVYGEESIAHLCLAQGQFSALLGGLWIREGNTFLERQINRIEELRELLTKNSSPIYRGNPDKNPYTGWYRRSYLLRKLLVWDFLSEESAGQVNR